MASIRKRGNSYQIIVSNGRDIHGKQLIETTTWTPDATKTDRQNQKALEKFVIEFEDKVKNGKYLDGEKITLKDFSDRWFTDYALLHLEPTTTDIYKILLDTHIIPAIGHLRLARIQPAHLNKLYKEMTEHRKDCPDNGYSPTTIKRVHGLISSILSAAVQWNVLTDNPCERVKPPKQTKNSDDIKFFTPEETSAFLSELDEEYRDDQIKFQHVLFFQLAIFCGVRRSEAIALTWNDIDFDNRALTINKATVLVKSKPYTKAPKNKTSVRVITIPEYLIKSLRRYRIEYNTYRLSIGDQWIGNEYLFIQWNGAQMYPSTMNGVMRKIINRYNKNHDTKLPLITPHGLRHTSATLLISENVDIRTVSNRLGHAQTSTTMNIYSHSLKKKDEVAADTLECLLTKKHA